MKCDRARCSAVLTVTRAQNFMGEIFIVQMAPLLELSYSPSQNCCTMYNRGQFYIFFKENWKTSLRIATKSARRKILGKYRTIDHFNNFDEGAILFKCAQTRGNVASFLRHFCVISASFLRHLSVLWYDDTFRYYTKIYLVESLPLRNAFLCYAQNRHSAYMVPGLRPGTMYHVLTSD